MRSVVSTAKHSKSGSEPEVSAPALGPVAATRAAAAPAPQRHWAKASAEVLAARLPTPVAVHRHRGKARDKHLARALRRSLWRPPPRPRPSAAWGPRAADTARPTRRAAAACLSLPRRQEQRQAPQRMRSYRNAATAEAARGDAPAPGGPTEPSQRAAAPSRGDRAWASGPVAAEAATAASAASVPAATAQRGALPRRGHGSTGTPSLERPQKAAAAARPTERGPVSANV
mmetsp:Transcript_174083/g.558145  ORF Transcript_174083/g.558145 Transcript_174083/m.558145 type:complete len:230 (-) Transcript_174083:350-1039(-)